VKKVGEIRIPKTKESQGKRTDDLISFTNNDDSSESDDVIYTEDKQQIKSLKDISISLFKTKQNLSND